MDIFLDILVPYLTNGKNNGAAIFNKHLYKKSHRIIKWSEKNDLLVIR